MTWVRIRENLKQTGLEGFPWSATLEAGRRPEWRCGMAEQLQEVDFARAAYREEGVWQVQELAHDVLENLEHVSNALRRFPGDFGAVGMVAYDEDVFLLVRVAGPTVRVLLSDITAA